MSNRIKRIDEHWATYIIPGLLWVFLISIFPVIYNFYLSFYQTAAGGARIFVGLANYIEMFTSPIFYQVLLNTVFWTAGIILGLLILSLGLALLLNTGIRGTIFYRIIMFLPWVIPGVVAGIIWEYMLNPSWGIINRFLTDIGIIQQYFPWLAETDTSLITVMSVYIWRTSPFSTVMFLAGLQAIPLHLYESAQIDGANTVQQFTHITLPQLLPVIKVVMLLLTIWTFNSFDITYALTKGGPLHSSEILAMRIYKYGFELNRFGLAASSSNIALLISAVIAILYLKRMES